MNFRCFRSLLSRYGRAQNYSVLTSSGKEYRGKIADELFNTLEGGIIELHSVDGHVEHIAVEYIEVLRFLGD